MLLGKNKKALWNYDLIKEYNGGLELLGGEVKSLKAKQLSWVGAFISYRNGEIWLKGLHISPYKYAHEHIEPVHDRKILLNRKEIEQIKVKLGEKGNTAIPIEIYTRKGWVKIRLAVAKGKRKQDKKQVLKERDVDRQAARDLKNY